MHLLKWLYPGMKFKRWLFLFAIGVILTGMGLAVVFNYKYLDSFEELLFYAAYTMTGTYDYTVTAIVGSIVIVCGVLIMLLATRMIIRSLITVLVPDKSGRLVDMIYEHRRLDKGPNITVVGGGTGLSVLLRGMKEVTRNVTAVVTVADDGGSSGRLREEFNVIPPGDLRNCLVALADTEPMMEKLFQYRFTGNSDLAGHSFGNLFITAMTEVTGDIEQALKESSRVLAVKGRVFPATTAKVRLSATMDDGSIVDGESQIPLVHKRIKRVHIFPRQVEAVPSTLKAIREAEVIVLGPGSLYTSVIPNLLVEDIAREIRESSAIKIYICNVMTQPGETDDYTASMHVRALIEHGGNGIVDYVLVNNKPISQEMQEHYAREGQYPVLVDENAIADLGVKCFKADIIDDSKMIHHDSLKLAHQVMEIYHTLQRDN
ncbi:gluconeogenesis factor YvcK family protein [Megamonas hypermegale]|uniref:gluconeogenesis factor YvcK family protein n=1 Tax=Megamonas hypermegale TaxID=158847 RepID=UPI0025A42909|nr:gluconeogenesis factor YvcK family protein [Megamonas hypermegale]MDM8143214.1 YvcK family protein [Megamonas hypermegale]